MCKAEEKLIETFRWRLKRISTVNVLETVSYDSGRASLNERITFEVYRIAKEFSDKRTETSLSKHLTQHVRRAGATSSATTTRSQNEL